MNWHQRVGDLLVRISSAGKAKGVREDERVRRRNHGGTERELLDKMAPVVSRLETEASRLEGR